MREGGAYGNGEELIGKEEGLMKEREELIESGRGFWKRRSLRKSGKGL